MTSFSPLIQTGMKQFQLVMVCRGLKNDDIRTIYGRHTDDLPTTRRLTDDVSTTLGRPFDGEGEIPDPYCELGEWVLLLSRHVPKIHLIR
jgi:hypothetical protein